MPTPSKWLMFAPALGLMAACSSNTPAYPPVSVAPPAATVPATPSALDTGTSGIAGTTARPLALTPTQIANTISNNTLTGIARNGVPYSIYFTSDGRQRFQQGNIRDAGTWHVTADGRFCWTFNKVSSGREECYVLYRSGDTITLQTPDGSASDTARLLTGNPEHI